MHEVECDVSCNHASHVTSNDVAPVVPVCEQETLLLRTSSDMDDDGYQKVRPCVMPG